MSCVIQIKGETGYRIFETEEQVHNYLRTHNLELATIKDKDGNDVVVLANVSQKKENSQIIKNSNILAYSEIKDVKETMSING